MDSWGGRVLGLVLIGLAACLCPRSSFAQGVTYLYDDLGRLKRVIDEHGNVATYNYDAVGNILSIERGAGACPVGPPTISQVTMGPCFVGIGCAVTIDGTSLLGAGVTTGNALAAMTDCRGDCTRVTCVLNSSPFISPGTVNFTLSTAFGSAQGSADIHLQPPMDSDGDGWPDELEVALGSDPFSAASGPHFFAVTPPAVSVLGISASNAAGSISNVLVGSPPVSVLGIGPASAGDSFSNVEVGSPPVSVLIEGQP